MRRMIHLVAAVTSIGLLSTACADGPGDVEAGDCFETGTAAAFGWGSEVDCDQPHTVEVFAVRDVSATLGQHPRGDLGKDGHPARQQYLALVSDFCEPEWSKYTGYDKLGASLAPGAKVLPALYGDMALEATPPKEWESGNKLVVCYQVFGRPGQQGEEPIRVDDLVLSGMATEQATVPIQVRDCATTPVGDLGEQRVPCTTLHDREYLGHLDAAQFAGRLPGLDQTFLDGFSTTTAPPEAWAVLDSLCTRVFGPLLDGSGQDATVLAQVYTDDQAWGWAPQEGSYHTACFAQTAQQTTTSILGSPAEPPGN